MGEKFEPGSALEEEREPGFWLWLFMGRKKQDAYVEAVLIQRGLTPEDAHRANLEMRFACRGGTISPWLREKMEETRVD